MTSERVAALILAAGQGTRMKSRLPKVLHPIAGRPMVGHLMETVRGLDPARTVVVAAPHNRDQIAAALPNAQMAVQDPPLGTAHAVLAAREALGDFDGDVLMLFGDTPLVTQATLAAMLRARRGADDPAVVVLGFRPGDPSGYGRLIRDSDGALDRIVEDKDASAEERAEVLCNSGVMALDGAVLFELLAEIGNDNAQGEYYMTDVVAVARARQRTCAVIEAPADELLGINSRAQLAHAEAIVQARLRDAAMAAGASLMDPRSVYFHHDTVLGRDVTIEPHVFFGPGVAIADDVVVRAYSHLEGCHIESGATVGPFARLRPGAAIGPEAHIGNFVEVKNASIEQGAKVNHLSYIGDARVGAKANVGAGTITCNYDGFNKSHTDIGAGAFIGSNTALVAPVKVGDGAIIGAGSVISEDVAADALALTRAEQQTRDGFAVGYRERKTAEKAKARAAADAAAKKLKSA